MVEVNGKTITRDGMRDYLKSKRITLWMDWIITEPSQMEMAIDWFMREISGAAASAV